MCFAGKTQNHPPPCRCSRDLRVAEFPPIGGPSSVWAAALSQTTPRVRRGRRRSSLNRKPKTIPRPRCSRDLRVAEFPPSEGPAPSGPLPYSERHAGRPSNPFPFPSRPKTENRKTKAGNRKPKTIPRPRCSRDLRVAEFPPSEGPAPSEPFISQARCEIT